MNYTEAIAAIESGNKDTAYAWRSAWQPGSYITFQSPNVWKYTPEGSGVYSPTTEDEAATDWVDGGDKPPAKAKK